MLGPGDSVFLFTIAMIHSTSMPSSRKRTDVLIIIRAVQGKMVICPQAQLILITKLSINMVFLCFLIFHSEMKKLMCFFSQRGNL